jgi:hypothetical protein
MAKGQKTGGRAVTLPFGSGNLSGGEYAADAVPPATRFETTMTADLQKRRNLPFATVREMRTVAR